RGWSLAFAMGGLSVGLLSAGLIAPTVGRMIDRHGGHVVMTVGSLTGAAGLVALVLAPNRVAYLAAWVVIGAAMAGNLYDSAFATLGRIFGAAARRPITVLTFIGGGPPAPGGAPPPPPLRPPPRRGPPPPPSAPPRPGAAAPPAPFPP